MPTRSLHRPAAGYWTFENGKRVRKTHAAPNSNIEFRQRARSASPASADEADDGPTDFDNNGVAGRPSTTDQGRISYLVSQRAPRDRDGRPQSAGYHKTSLITPSMAKWRSRAGSPEPAVARPTATLASYMSPPAGNDTSPASVVSAILHRFTSKVSIGSNKPTTPPQKKNPTKKLNPNAPEANPRFAARNRDYHSPGRPYAMHYGLNSSGIAVSPVATPDMTRANAIGSARRFGQRPSPHPTSKSKKPKQRRSRSHSAERIDRNTNQETSSESDSESLSPQEVEEKKHVQAMTKRILEQRARLHHDDPWLNRNVKKLATKAVGRLHHKPQNVRPKYRVQEGKTNDGPLGGPRPSGQSQDLLTAAAEKAAWGAKPCSCSLSPCSHTPSLPGNVLSRLAGNAPRNTAETKQGGVTHEELKQAAANWSRREFRRQAGIHNSNTAFSRGRVNGSL